MPWALHSKATAVAIAVAGTALVAMADHLTGTQTVMEIFYLLPVLLMAWRVGLGAALVLGAAGATIRLVDDLFILRSSFEHPAIPYWNTVAALATYAVAAEVVSLLRRANERLRASEAMREDLTHMLVHDLKNPLVTAAMALDLYRRHQAEPGARTEQWRQSQEELLRVAADSNERMRRLIEDILDVARAEAAQMPVELELVDVTALAQAAVRAAEARARRAEIRLQEAYPPEPATLEADAAKLRRVLDNLLDNAFKHTLPGGAITVEIQRQGSELWVSVADDGEGIARDQQRHIFDKFRQAPTARERSGMSVGLGLAFAKLAVERQGGRIWVESEPGQGARFTFALPLAN